MEVLKGEQNSNQRLFTQVQEKSLLKCEYESGGGGGVKGENLQSESLRSKLE